MLDQQMIANIRESGLAQGHSELDKRARLLQQELGFRLADRAEYVLIASCYLPSMVTEDMKAFRNLLHYFELDYTLLPREHCCGNLLFQQALKDKTGEDLGQAEALGREFLEANLRQLRELGASKILTFCVGCDLVYSRFKDAVHEEVVWFPTLLASMFRGGKLELRADYYAGCHYLYRRLNATMPDLDSPLRMLDRIEGLELNHLNHRLCCTRLEQRESLVTSVRNRIVITLCGGCAIWLQEALKDRGDYRVVMLPQVVWAAVSGHTL